MFVSSLSQSSSYEKYWVEMTQREQTRLTKCILYIPICLAIPSFGLLERRNSSGCQWRRHSFDCQLHISLLRHHRTSCCTASLMWARLHWWSHCHSNTLCHTHCPTLYSLQFGIILCISHWSLLRQLFVRWTRCVHWHYRCNNHDRTNQMEYLWHYLKLCSNCC